MTTAGLPNHPRPYSRPQADVDAEAKANNDPVLRYLRFGFTLLLVPLS